MKMCVLMMSVDEDVCVDDDDVVLMMMSVNDDDVC